MIRRVAIALVVLVLVTSLSPVVYASGLDHGDERADLDIRQPAYVDSSVERETTDNRTTYEIRGDRHEIRLESVNHSDVEASGVLEGSGSIEYDEAVDAWIFDAEGEAGTRVVYFDVVETTISTEEQTVEGTNGTTTEEVEIEERTESRHVATLSVSNVNWAHRPEEEDDQLRQDAANWSSVSSEARRLGGGDAVETVLEDAFDYYEFARNPFASFFADARGTVIMATTPGGLAVFGGLLGLSASILGFALVRLHRKERQLEQVGDVDEATDEAYLDMAERILQQRDWDEFLPDHLARFCREYLGRNCWLGLKRYTLLRSPTQTKGIVLQLMGQVGYVGRAVVDDAGDIVEAEVVLDDDLDDVATDGGAEPIDVDLTQLDSGSDRDRRFVDLVDGSSLDIDLLYQPDRLDLDAVEWPIDERQAADSEVLEAINPEFPDDFEDEEELADALSALLQLVANHEFTTEDGRPREERDLLSFLSELDSVLSDEVDFPLVPVQRRVLMLAAERMDKGEELQHTVDRLSEEGLELGGELGLSTGDEDDDPDGGAGALGETGGDDGDDPDGDAGDGSTDVSTDTGIEDEESESTDESDAPVDGRRRETTGDDGSNQSTGGDLADAIASGDADGVSLAELTEAAGYDVSLESEVRRLADDAGLSGDMDSEEISSRVLVHCRREIPSEEFVELLSRGGGER